MHGHEKLKVVKGTIKGKSYLPSLREDIAVDVPVNELMCECGLLLMRSKEPIRPEDVSGASLAWMTTYREHIGELMLRAQIAKAQVEVPHVLSQASERRRAKPVRRRADELRGRLREGDRVAYIGLDPNWEGATGTIEKFDIWRSKVQLKDQDVPKRHHTAMHVPDWLFMNEIELARVPAPTA